MEFIAHSLLPLVKPQLYLDPGSGSFILQLLLAALLGATVALRMYWGRVKSFFRRLASRDHPSDRPPDAED